MSALNAFATVNSVYLFTDAAVIDPETAVITSLIDKVVLLPHLNAAIACTGNTAGMALFAVELISCNFDDFDDLIAQASPILERLMTGGSPEHFTNLRVVFAGFSAREDAPRIYCLQNDSGIGVEKLKLTSSPTVINPAGVNDTDRSITTIPFESLWPTRSGLRIMNAQREKKFGPYHGIGGWCQMTTITRNGIATQVLERWPDKIGHRITPAKRRPAVGTFGTLS